VPDSAGVVRVDGQGRSIGLEKFRPGFCEVATLRANEAFWETDNAGPALRSSATCLSSVFLDVSNMCAILLNARLRFRRDTSRVGSLGTEYADVPGEPYQQCLLATFDGSKLATRPPEVRETKRKCAGNQGEIYLHTRGSTNGENNPELRRRP
jgi:hypothetical protein